MTRPKSPATYQLDIGSTSIDVQVGDVILAWTSDVTLSNVSNSLVIDHQGYDSGYLKAFIIEGSGTLDISTSGVVDVIHTGNEDGTSISGIEPYLIHEWESEQTFGEFSDYTDEPHADFSDHTDYGGGNHEDWGDHADDGSGAYDDFTDEDYYDHGNHWDHYDENADPEYQDYQDYHDHWDGDHDDFADHGDFGDHNDQADHNDFSDHTDTAQQEETAHGDAPELLGLMLGDLIIEWDEGDIGEKDWQYGGEIVHLYTDTTSSISRGVWQARETAKLERTISCCQEHDALHFNINTVPATTNLVARATSDVEVDLTWESDVDPHNFYIYRKRKRADFSQAYKVDGSLRSFSDEDVSSGVDYIYQVQAGRPRTSPFDLGTNETSVSIGDLIIIYDDASISGISYSNIVKDIGSDGGRFEVYIANESGVVSIDSGGPAEVIYRGRKDTESVDNTYVRLSSEDGSNETFAEGLTAGDIIIQWDESDVGDETGYLSFSGDLRTLYTHETSKADRRVSQVFTGGDATRTANGVELAAIGVELSPISGLNSTFGNPSNEDDAQPTYPYIAIR